MVAEISSSNSNSNSAQAAAAARQREIAIERQQAAERAAAQARAEAAEKAREAASARLSAESHLSAKQQAPGHFRSHQKSDETTTRLLPGATVHLEHIDFGQSHNNSSSRKTNGSTVVSDLAGQVTEVIYKDGQSRRFGYDSQGNLDRITETDGKVFTLRGDKWLTSQGTAAGITVASVNKDGVYSFETKKGQIVISDTSGLSTVRDLNTEPTATLSRQAAKQAAEELHAAIHNQGFWGASPDSDKALNILSPLNSSDTRAVEQAYQQLYNTKDSNALLDDMRNNFGSEQFSQAQAMLNRQNGRTNDAGNVMVALTLAGSDQEKGNALLRQTFEQLNSLQIQQLKLDFQKNYGESLEQAIANSKNISSDTVKALPILEKGIDNRTSANDVALAKLAVQNGDINLFGESLNGDSHAAQQARRELQSDKQFMNQFITEFTDARPATYGRFGQTSPAETPSWENANPVAKDLLTQGSVSLATIADGDTGHLIGFLNNDANLSLAATNATPSERQQYSEGLHMAESGNNPSNGSQREALDYYNQIHTAFSDGGSAIQASIWQDELLHGRNTIVTQLTGAHDGGWGPFHWNAHTDTNQLLTTTENLSRQDWELLHDPNTRQQFMSEIENSLSTYASQPQAQAVLNLLRQKGEAGTYQDSQSVKRDLYEFAQANSSNGKSIDDRLKSMTTADAHNYQNNATYRAQVDAFINSHLSGDQKIYAQMMLSQVAKTGKPPQPTDAEQVLSDSINGVPTAQAYADIKAALADSHFRSLMSQPDGALNAQDLAIKNAITTGLFNASRSLFPIATGGRGGTDYVSEDSPAFQENILHPMLQTGKLAPALEIKMGLPKYMVYSDIAGASVADRNEAMALLSSNEQVIAQNVINQHGKMDLADQIESFAIGDGSSYQQFKAPLEQMNSAQLDALKSEFAKKYGTDLDEALLSKVSSADKQLYGNLLTTDTQDGRQDFYNNLLKMNFSGFSPDGTQLTAERASELDQAALAKYQSEYKQLPPDLQHKLDQYFGTAMEQYRSSKEKLAEIAVDATITAAALAAAPFSGGLSLGAIGAIAAGGAAFRVAAMKAIEGNDFNGSVKNVLEQAVIGGTSAALNFIGPGLFNAEGPLADIATSTIADAASSALTSAGGSALSETARSSLSSLVASSLRSGSLDGAKLTEFASSQLPPDATGSERAAVEEAIKSEFVRQSVQYTDRLTHTAVSEANDAAARQYGKPNLVTDLLKTAGQNAVIGAGSNVFSNLVVAPFAPGGINTKQLLTSALSGAVAGAAVGVIFEGAKGVISAVHLSEGTNSVKAEVTRGPDGAVYIQPSSDSTEPIEIRTQSGETKLVTQSTRLDDGDQIVDGPSPTKTDLEGAVPMAAITLERPISALDRVMGLFRREHQSSSPPTYTDVSTAPRSVLTIDGQVVPPGKPISIGRDGAAGVTVSASTVSSQHAYFMTDTQGHGYILDDSSRNGTTINGRTLESGQWHMLHPGDRVSVGEHELTFQSRLEPTYDMYAGSGVLPLNPGQEIKLGRNTPGLGRMGISRDHITVGMDDRGIYVYEEPGKPSTNGSFVNRQRIRPGDRIYLKPTDEVRLGVGNGLVEQINLWPTAADLLRPPSDLYTRDPAAANAAIIQSNKFAVNRQLDEKIKDGFELLISDNQTYFGPDGELLHPSIHPVMVVDRADDPVLRSVEVEAKAKFADLPIRQRAEALLGYVHALMKPKNMTEPELSEWYERFYTTHPNQKLLLGEFIREGRGVCAQQALLYKVLGDDLGLDVNYVWGQAFGPSAGRAYSINHAWCEVRIPGDPTPFVFDPRNSISAATYQNLDFISGLNLAETIMPSHWVIRQINEEHYSTTGENSSR